MKIEMLYPEVCNLFGDISNIKYLKKCLPDAEIIKTEINSEPAFVTQDIDMIYKIWFSSLSCTISQSPFLSVRDIPRNRLPVNTPGLFTRLYTS